MSAPETDVIVPCHNALEYVKECVRTLYEHTPSLGRLIIVDDFSDEDTRTFLYGPDCVGRGRRNLYLRTNRQVWFSRASNMGLRLAGTERVVLLNSDCVVNSGWLEEMYGVWADFKEKNPHRSLGLVGHIGYETERRYLETSESNGNSYVTGHAWLISREALDAMANARGTPGRYLNEVDPGCIHIASDRVGCWELNRLGFATLGALQVAVGHVGGKSWNYDLGRVAGIRLQDVD